MKRVLLCCLIGLLAAALATRGAPAASAHPPALTATMSPQELTPTAAPSPSATALPQASSTITRVLELEAEYSVADVAWSLDGTLFAVAQDARVDLYDGQSMRKLRSFETNILLEHVSVGADGATVVAANGEQSRVVVWESSSGELLQSFGLEPAEGPGQRQVALSQDGGVAAWMFLSQGLRKLELWNTRDKALLHTLALDALVVDADGVFSPDGRLFAIIERLEATDLNPRISIVDVASGQVVGAPINLRLGGPGFSAVFSQDNRRLFGGHGRVWNIAEQTWSEGRYDGWPLWVSADGAQVASFRSDEGGWIWDVAQARRVLAFPPELGRAEFRSLSFRPDGGAVLMLGAIEKPLPTPAQTPVIDDARQPTSDWSFGLTLWLFVDRPQPAPLQTMVVLRAQEQQRRQTEVAATRTAFSALYPVQGSIDMPDGIIGGTTGEAVTLTAILRASGREHPVTEMRLVQARGLCPSVEDVERAPWQPFEPERTLTYTLFSGHHYLLAAVQYRDAAGTLSRIYCDGPDSDGMPPARDYAPLDSSSSSPTPLPEQAPVVEDPATATPLPEQAPVVEDPATATPPSEQAPVVEDPATATPPSEQAPSAPTSEPPLPTREPTPTRSGAALPAAQVALGLVVLGLGGGLLLLARRRRS